MTTLIVIYTIVSIVIPLLAGRGAHYGNPSSEKPMIRRRNRRWLHWVRA